MARFDTTPSDDDRVFARDLLARGAGHTNVRHELVLRMVGGYVEALTELDDPGDAHIVARARALYDAYREDTHQ